MPHFVSIANAQTSFNVERFIVEGDNPVSSAETDRIVAPYAGQQGGIEQLQQAAAALENEFRRQGFFFHRVTLPPQVLESGTVTLKVHSLTVGDISVSGNQYHSDQNIRRSLPQLQHGQTPHTRSLSRALAIANINTAKQTHLTFARGSTDDTLDVAIGIKDEAPQQGFAWLNNTGTQQTTRTRFGAGYQHRNLFDLDHDLTASYTSSPEDLNSVQQYGLSYQLPVYPATGILGMFYANSDIDSGRVADFFDVGGSGQVRGLRYSQILNNLGNYRQRIEVDLFDKLFDNDVDFSGTQLGVDVRSRPLSAAWVVEWDRLRTKGQLNLSYAVNLNGGSFNSQADYTASRAGASQDWSALRLEASQDFELGGQWRLDLNARAQYADEPLIAGEQLGLGGTIGPRGFDEREVGVDRGLELQVQLWAPALAGNIRPGVFVDHGLGDIVDSQPGEVSNRNMTSVGVSATWQYQDNLVASMDAAYVVDGLEEPTLTQDSDSRIHFSLVYRFRAQ